MELDQMIEVLQAAKRGEKIEVLIGGEWLRLIDPNFNFQSFSYRIAPKKEMTLVEELRLCVSPYAVVPRDIFKRAADRIEELEEILHTNVERIDNDLLMVLLKKRLQK